MDDGSKKNEKLFKEYKNGRLVITESIAEIPPFAFAEQREITEVYIPDRVERIGAHAFYNCRSLNLIHIENCAVDVGDGAFKNCERLRKIELVKNKDELKSLKSILFDAHRQVSVRLIYPDGEACLVFPYFMDNYEENTPARIVMHISEGSGTIYRECIYAGDVDYKAYDDLFKTGQNLDIYDASVEIALKRLHFPYKLSENAKGRYEDFLKLNFEKIAVELAEEKNVSALDELFSLEIAGYDKLKNIAEILRGRGDSLSLAVCLKYYGQEKEKSKPRYVF